MPVGPTHSHRGLIYFVTHRTHASSQPVRICMWRARQCYGYAHAKWNMHAFSFSSSSRLETKRTPFLTSWLPDFFLGSAWSNLRGCLPTLEKLVYIKVRLRRYGYEYRQSETDGERSSGDIFTDLPKYLLFVFFGGGRTVLQLHRHPRCLHTRLTSSN